MYRQDLFRNISDRNLANTIELEDDTRSEVYNSTTYARYIILYTFKTGIYVATMEPGNSTAEQQLFDNEYDPVNTVSTKPAGFDNLSSNTQVVKLNASAGVNKKTGPGLLLKVMFGDQVQLSTYSFFNTTVQPPGGSSSLAELLASLSEGVTGSSGGKFGPGSVAGANNAITAAITSFFTSGRPYTSTLPKAYLNWVLLDEQLNYVPAGSGARQVQAGSSKQVIAPGMLSIPQNGYLYVYVSNESPQDVYFDDITVQHFKGPLLQEQSYYPLGGDMKALCSQAFAAITTRHKYNSGTEQESSFDINYYETFYRNYDAQVGRFTGVDMRSEQNLNVSPYQFAINNPILYNDPLGDYQSLQQIRQSHREGLHYSISERDLSNPYYDCWSYTYDIDHSRRWASLNSYFNALIANVPNGKTIYSKDVTETTTTYNYSNILCLAAFYTFNYHGEVTFTEGERYFFDGVTTTAPLQVQGMDAQSGGGSWDAANTTLNAFGFASGIKETIIEGGAALNRGINISKVNDVSLLRTYGASGAKYLKIFKGLGIAGSIVTTGYSLSKVYDQYNAPGGLNNVLSHRDVLDAGVGMAGIGAFFFLSNPVGWGIGAGVLIYGGATMIYDAYNDKK